MTVARISPRWLCAALLALLLAAGCSAPQVPKADPLTAKSRIGILNLLDRSMTHEHVGELRFDSFRKSYRVGWDLPESLTARVAAELRRSSPAEVLVLDAGKAARNGSAPAEDIHRAAGGWVSNGLRTFLEELSAENRLDRIVVMASYADRSCFNIAGSPIALQGYGLYTRGSLVSDVYNVLPLRKNAAFAYAQIDTVVFRFQPFGRLGAATAPCREAPLADFPWPADIRNLPSATLDRLQPDIRKMADEAALRALEEAGP
jgi:hypothetical protein